MLHGAIAPSPTDSAGSGTSSSGSITICAPRPWQCSQAPCGELNEKIRGSSSTSEGPCSGQAKRSEKVKTVPSGGSSPGTICAAAARVPSAPVARPLPSCAPPALALALPFHARPCLAAPFVPRATDLRDLGRGGLAVVRRSRPAGGARQGGADHLDLDQPVRECDRGLDRVGQALAHVVAHDQAVDHDRDVVLVALVEHDRFLEQADAVVDPHAREAFGAQLLELLAVLALAPAHDRRHHHEARAVRQLHHLVDDLLRRLPHDRPPADRAVRLADPRPQQAQVVVDLGHRADGRARVARGRLLVDRDRRRETLDRVDVRLVHLAQELARVGRERLDVAALALRVDRVEREARLARAR